VEADSVPEPLRKEEVLSHLEYVTYFGGIRTIAWLPETALADDHPLRADAARVLHKGRRGFVIVRLPDGLGMNAPLWCGSWSLDDYVPDEVPLEAVRLLTSALQTLLTKPQR
jgi:hypothetical protein